MRKIKVVVLNVIGVQPSAQIMSCDPLRNDHPSMTMNREYTQRNPLHVQLRLLSNKMRFILLEETMHYKLY